MARSPLVSLWLVAVVLAADASSAETRSPLLKEAEPFVAPAPPPSGPKRPRAISPELAAQLTAMHPKFEALAPTAKTAPPADPAAEPTDPVEPDKPRNRIIRLPSYLVQEDRVLPLKERELLSPKSRLDLALKRHPGLRLGNIGPFRNDGIALFMLQEEERVERMKEMADLVSLLSITEQKTMKPVVERTFMRQSDMR